VDGGGKSAVTAEIVYSAFERAGSEANFSVPKESVLTWMRTSDLSVRGVLYTMLTTRDRAACISPPLKYEDYDQFVWSYLFDCIEKNPDDEWADSRYLAANQLAAWFVGFWTDEAVPRDRLVEIKDMLARHYQHANSEVREALINGVLEHIFEHQGVPAFFADWQRDETLLVAYKEAQAWSSHRKRPVQALLTEVRRRVAATAAALRHSRARALRCG